MTLKEIKKQLQLIQEKGFVPSLRRGATGVGHTLQTLLQISENNLSIPDIDGRVELKATRKNSSSLISLFTFNRGVWIKLKEKVIEEFGYLDDKNRLSLYSTVYSGKVNAQGLTIQIDKGENKIKLVHQPTGELVAVWSIFLVVGIFVTKLDKVILVFAETRENNEKKEEFHYNKAYLLTTPSPEKFLEAFDSGIIAIDIRMHLKENGEVRNHGTAMRTLEKRLPYLYEKKEVLIANE